MKYVNEHEGEVVMDKALIEREFCKYMKENFSLKTRGNLSDIFESKMSTAYPFGAGHGRQYWGRMDVGTEAFAEITASILTTLNHMILFSNIFQSLLKFTGR